MSIQHTLFKPGGEPLRAKVKFSFVVAMRKTESQLMSQLSSPDLTHELEVWGGDTLPLQCNRL